MILVFHDVLLLELTHALDLVEIDNEALIVSVERLDTLATEDVQMVTAVEVLDALGMLLAKLLRQAFLILILEVEARACQDWVLLDNLVQNVDVEGESLSTLELLDELAADGAADAVFVMQLLDAVGAESVPAVHKYARDALSHVVLEPTELTDVQSARLVVKVHKIDDAHVGF